MAVDLRGAIEAKLPNLVSYVRELRTPPFPWSWDMIAADLHRRTGVSVSRETLRVWFRDDNNSKGEPQ